MTGENTDLILQCIEIERPIQHKTNSAILKASSGKNDDDPEEEEEDPVATNEGQPSYFDSQDSPRDEGNVDAQEIHQHQILLILDIPDIFHVMAQILYLLLFTQMLLLPTAQLTQTLIFLRAPLPQLTILPACQLPLQILLVTQLP